MSEQEPHGAYLDRDLWHPPQIVGRLVALRRPHPNDLPSVVRWYRDREIARLTRYQARPMSQGEVERFFQLRMLAPDALAYSIVELPDWRLIGFTTFSSLDGDNGSVLFHITIGERDAWGRGLGTEATELMLAHAFERLGLHRVGLSVFSYNLRAIAPTRKPVSRSRAGCVRRYCATASTGMRSRWACSPLSGWNAGTAAARSPGKRSFLEQQQRRRRYGTARVPGADRAEGSRRRQRAGRA